MKQKKQHFIFYKCCFLLSTNSLVYQAAGIPVFISSIASNLADQAPFSSSALSVGGEPVDGKPVAGKSTEQSAFCF